MKLTEDEIREYAKDAGIKNVGNKKIENIIKALEAEGHEGIELKVEPAAETAEGDASTPDEEVAAENQAAAESAVEESDTVAGGLVEGTPAADPQAIADAAAALVADKIAELEAGFDKRVEDAISQRIADQFATTIAASSAPTPSQTQQGLDQKVFGGFHDGQRTRVAKPLGNGNYHHRYVAKKDLQQYLQNGWVDASEADVG